MIHLFPYLSLPCLVEQLAQQLLVQSRLSYAIHSADSSFMSIVAWLTEEGSSGSFCFDRMVTTISHIPPVEL